MAVERDHGTAAGRKIVAGCDSVAADYNPVHAAVRTVVAEA